MSKIHRFDPVPRFLSWVEREPTKHAFTVHFKFVRSFNPVITLPIYMSNNYRDCFDYLEAVTAIMPNTKYRQTLVKQVGSRHRHYYYDQSFADALQVQDVDGDEYFEEPTADDKRYVMLHQKKGIVRAVWKGAVIRGDDGKQPSFDSVLDREDGGLG